MNRASLWQKTKRKLHGMTGAASRELKARAAALGSTPAMPFADISNNNALTSDQIRAYAKNHYVIAIKASEGRTWTDPDLKRYVEVAKDAGLIVMPYHFARPDNNTPIQEARAFVAACRAAGLRLGPRRRFWYQRDELPGVLDYEVAHPHGADALWIHQFMQEYRKLTRHGTAKWRGKTDAVTSNCILYGGAIVRENVPNPITALYWLAAYTATAEPYWPSGLSRRHRLAWQFTDRGQFKAFGGAPTDRSRFVGNLKLRDIIGLAT